MKLLTAFLLIVGIAVISCKKDPDQPCPCTDERNPGCPNYDPCSTKPEPKADIIFSEGVSFDTKWIVENSIFEGRSIKFESPYSNDTTVKHTWYLGREIITESSFVRTFLNVKRPATIPISLTIKYPVDSICYPFSLGYDSITETMYFAEYYDELNSVGQFKVARFGTQDSFLFETGFYLRSYIQRDTNFDYRVPVYTDFVQFPSGYKAKAYVYNFEDLGQYREVGSSATNSYFDSNYGFMKDGVNISIRELRIDSNNLVAIRASEPSGITAKDNKFQYLGRKLH